jgi:hypothetical protein
MSLFLMVGDMGPLAERRNVDRVLRFQASKEKAPENLESVMVLRGERLRLSDEPALSTMGTAHLLNVGNNMGMFVVIIATKVSRTAQEAAS